MLLRHDIAMLFLGGEAMLLRHDKATLFLGGEAMLFLGGATELPAPVILAICKVVLLLDGPRSAADTFFPRPSSGPYLRSRR